MAYTKRPLSEKETVAKKHDETAEEFEARFSSMASSAYTILGVALGDRLGLFRQMASMKKPWTPKELADAGNWKERYIVEYLGAMVCGGIVEVVPSAEGDRYFLPKHRHKILLSEAAIMHQGLPIFGAVHEDIVGCFPKSGPAGVAYEKYPHFHEWCDDYMKETKTWDYIRHFNEITPGLTEKLEAGGRFLGVGCSTGIVELMYATHYPKSTFIGADLSDHAIQEANGKVKKQGLSNIEFRVQDVYKMPQDWTGTFDGVIGFDVLHDFPFPDKAAKEFHRVLKVGGILVFSDVFSHSRIADNRALNGAVMMYSVSLYHCMPVSLDAGGTGAGAMWGRERTIECLKAGGFDDVLEPEFGSAQYVCVKK